MDPTRQHGQAVDSANALSPGHVVEVAQDPGGARYVVLEVLNTLDGLAARLWRVAPDPAPMPSIVLVERLSQVTLELDEPRRSVLGIVAEELLHPWSARTSAAFTARADFKPFQFRPLLKFHGEGARHVLIADETGLGKTIEAGYIIAEEIARFQASRVVVLCPSRLRRKWYAELWGRFGLPFHVVGARSLLNLLERAGEPVLAIASMDGGRSLSLDDIEALPGNLPVDVLVIDEVHRMIGRGIDTIRRQFGLALAQRSRAVIGLSATPVQIEMGDLKRVLDLVAPGELDENLFEVELAATSAVKRVSRSLESQDLASSESAGLVSAVRDLASVAQSLHGEAYASLVKYAEDLAAAGQVMDANARRRFRREALDKTVLLRTMTRTRATDVGEDRRRLVKTIRVQLSEEVASGIQGEKKVTITEAGYYAVLDSFLRQSFSHVHRIQLSSCIPAMVDLLRLGAMGYAAWEAKDLDEEESGSATSGTRSSEKQRAECQRLADMYGLITSDTKWKAFSELLRELKDGKSVRKAIAFTHWIPTFRYLAERVTSLRAIPVYKASADMDDEAIAREVGNFQTHEGFALLLTTDVLREGLDLDAADCVINYDIPYNPQVVEQRIGRVDRIGQKSSDIRVYNLIVSGSLDDLIYTRVLSRIGVFEHSIGDMRPVLEEMTERAAKTGSADVHEIDREVSLIEDVRRLMEHGAFLAVEEVLDEDIRRAHESQSDSMVNLMWFVLATFFQILDNRVGTGWDPATSSLMLSGVSSDLVGALQVLVGLDSREEISAMFGATGGGSKSMYLNLGSGRHSLPLAHPLIRTSLLLLSSAGALPQQDSQSPPHLRLNHWPPNLQESFRRVVLVEYRYAGDHVRERRRCWWGQGPSGVFTRLGDVRTDRLLEACLASGSAGDPLSESQLRLIADATTKDFNEWTDARAKGEHDLRLLAAQAALRTARARLHRLEARLAAVTEGGGTVARKVGEVRSEVEMLEGRVEDLRFGSQSRALSEIASWRVALVLTLRRD